MISPATDATGSSLPSTAHSISRIGSIACSTSAFRAYRNASSIPASSSAWSWAFVIPTEEPRVAGFVKTGNPRASARACTPSGSSRQRGSVTTSWGTTGRPRSEEHTSELQSHVNLVCRLLLEKKKKYECKHIAQKKKKKNKIKL